MTPTPPSSSLETAPAPAASTGTPCAGCKFLRRKCQPDCVFAPYFPADQPHRFAHVHKVFGASNVAKLLHELAPHQRGDAASSLAYEAEMRHRDPVYGCVGVISVLQHQLRQLQMDLALAKSVLSKYHGASAVNGVAAGVVDINMDGALAFGEMAMERGSLFLAAAAREQQRHSMLMTSCEAAQLTAGMAEGGACDAEFMVGDLDRLVPGQFMEPRATGEDERQAMSPS
ncbi:hypothetical protein Taro_008580 [Colocasia esculenta]|uniref:LOB domain-containing protein n=1 Tax=Colocasia esculenta TaxID=4460 RepID=A0A843TU17_COLES|nr:hypothetical protein [Colocasia esculenta]